VPVDPVHLQGDGLCYQLRRQHLGNACAY
jgi:hypothetical protein